MVRFPATAGLPCKCKIGEGCRAQTLAASMNICRQPHVRSAWFMAWTSRTSGLKGRTQLFAVGCEPNFSQGGPATAILVIKFHVSVTASRLNPYASGAALR